jgi:molybdopterin converting factor small subunit
VKLRILYFGVLKDLMGSNHSSPESHGLEGEEMELPIGVSVAALIEKLQARAPQSEIWRSLAVAVNRNYASADEVLHDGDEVALLPPVSGG